MGLRNGSSATIGIGDLDVLLAAFEEINEIHVKVEIERKLFKGRRELFCTAAAFERKDGSQVAKCLASESVRCLGFNALTMDSLIIRLLYTLDSQLAEGAFREAVKK